MVGVPDAYGELVAALDEAIGILAAVGESHWRAWLQTGREQVVRGDPYGTQHLLRAFGGMGASTTSC